MKNRQYIIKHPSQLNSLSTLPFVHRTGLGQLVLSDSYQNENKEQVERDLNRNYYACGCSQGSKALLIGILIFGIAGIYGFYNDWPVAKILTVFFGGVVMMAILGKFYGLAQANRKLKKTVAEIQSVWKPDWPEATAIDCG